MSCRMMTLFLALLVAVPVLAQEEELTVTVAEQAPPSEVAAPIAAALGPESIQLVGAEGPALEFWLRSDVPVTGSAENPEAALKGIEEGTLLGVVRLNEDRRDFRDDKVKAGVYTLRYALQPQDGDHMGTAPVPYFVLLTPADVDKELEGVKGHDAVVKLAQVAKHPRSFNLRPAENVEGEFPRVEEGFDETKMVRVKVPAKGDGGAEVPLAFGIVYEGHGEV